MTMFADLGAWINRMKTQKRQYLVAALALFMGSAWAAPRVTSVTVEVTSLDAPITTLAVGDRYELSFTLEDSTMDSNLDSGTGAFLNLVTAWTMTALPGNTGSWVPSGTAALNLGDYTTNSVTDTLSLQIGGSGFPSGGVGADWVGFVKTIDWPPGINDTGGADTLAEQLGVTPFGVPPGVLTFRILFEGGVPFAEARLAVVEPGTDPGTPPVRPAPAVPVAMLSPAGLILLIALLGWSAIRRYT